MGILIASSGAVQATNIINYTTPCRRLVSPPDEETEDMSHDYCLNPGYITECSSRIVTYVAGFVVRSLH